jgi:hypothetical protein
VGERLSAPLSARPGARALFAPARDERRAGIQRRQLRNLAIRVVQQAGARVCHQPRHV